MRMVSFSPPDISESEIQEVVKTLGSGWITTGIRTKLFESKIAEYVKTSKAVCLNSATAGMELCLRILGIGPGDEVITSAYTYTASASVIEHVGAKIVMVDTQPDSFEINYDKIANAITENTKAIIPVDIGGKMCDYDRIFNVLNAKKSLFKAKNDLQKLYGRVLVLADAAHSFGASRNGKNSGQAADFTSFSFHAVKNLTTGEGGAVTWRDMEGLDNEWLYKQFMLYSLHGQTKDAFHKDQPGAWEYDIIYPAYKCNMPDIMAAIGLKQLERYETMCNRRKQIITKYDRAFLPFNISRLVHYDEENNSSGHLYLIRIPNIKEAARNDIIMKMALQGVTCNVHYKPLPMMTAYKNLGFDIADFPNAYANYENEISLPLNTCMSDEDVEYVIEKLKECMDQCS